MEGEQRKVYYRATQEGQMPCAQKTQTLMGFSKVFLIRVHTLFFSDIMLLYIIDYSVV